MTAGRSRGEGRPTLAVVGATGLAGTVLLDVLSTRQDVWGEVRLVASNRSAGRLMRVRGEELVVQPLAPEVFDGVDIAMFDLPDDETLRWAPIAVERGAVVVDNSSAYRMDPDVPLVAPDVNPAQVTNRPKGVVANPGSTTLTVLDSVMCLHQQWGLTELVVTAHLAASGAGAGQRGVDRLMRETDVVSGASDLGQRPGDVRSAISERLGRRTSPFPAPLALNVVPWVGTAEDAGWSSEELKVRREMRKILGVPELRVATTCVRVPVLTGYSVAVHARFQRDVDVARARRALVEAPSVVMLDDVESLEFPTPVDVVGADPAFVGRLRQARDFPNSLDWFVCGDNLRRGAAINTAR
ncbi:MAG TPA: aspartate-semialdehyde dehydrogenase, partial [Actinomycetales bacterium]|nr:aspartate-semialdehyde dehydrogenase [Actinomycetales bacterium]